MNVLIKVTVPNIVYRFYKDASKNVAGCTPEALMADALSAYACLLSKSIANENLWKVPELQDSSSLPGIK